MATRQKKTTSELTEVQFAILRDAVNISRQYQVHSVKILRVHLKRAWPKKPKSIEVALHFWADNAATRKFT